MKKLIVSQVFLILTWVNVFTQEVFQPKSAAVVAIEARNLNTDGITLGNILRNELIKIETFTVVDRYETNSVCEALEIDPLTCLGRSCLVKVGSELDVDKMISGSVDRYSGQIIITLRVIDVASGEIEYNYIQEFINVEENLPAMLGLSVKKMYDMSVDEALWKKLTDEYDYENTINTPKVTRLKLNGPRMGFGYVTGMDGEALQRSTQSGGFDAWPVMSQFGYQFEVSYLNEGNVQALFEFVPTIAGLEQGLFIPSISVLHGIRSNISGLEFAFGPIFLISKKADGFEFDGEWYLEDERGRFPDEDLHIEKRLDSRGNRKIESGLVLAIGRTFKSGKVNFPVNLVSVLKKSGIRLGLSFGFNASSEKL